MRIARFLGGGGDGIESDVGEKDDCASGDDSGKAGRREGRPVGGLDQHATDNEEGKDGADFNGDHDVVGLGRFLHSAHQKQREDEDDEEAGKIEAGARPLSASPDGTRPFVRQVDTEGGELSFRITGEADRYGHVADHVFKNQVPADDPGKDFAEGCVGVSVGAAGDGDHRGQFGVAQSGKAAGDGHQEKRNGDGGSGWRAAVHERSGGAAGAQKIHDHVERLRVQEGRRLEIFSSGGGAREDEDSRADDGADAERGQRPRAQRFTEPVLRVLRVRDQLVDRLATEKLAIGSADGARSRFWG